MTISALCYSCRTAPRAGDSAYCPPCGERAAEDARRREAFNREVECPDCQAAAGTACITGSGGQRGIVHVTREKLANRREKGAA
jgi:hypothetical protein